MTERETKKEYEKKFWKSLNKKCLNCQRECKQSALVKVISCSLFVKKEKDDNKTVTKNLS